MGLLGKLRKKTAPKPDSITSGGSNIYRYEEKDNKGWRPPAAFGEYAESYAFMPPTWNPGDEFQLSTDIPDSEYWIIHMLKFLARFPHEYETWFGAGHTIPNGPDYEPICEGTTMGGVVLSQSGGDLECITTKDGKRINFLMVVPAYKEEIEYKLKYGMSVLDKKFCDNNMQLIIDIHRPNYCADFTEVLD